MDGAPAPGPTDGGWPGEIDFLCSAFPSPFSAGRSRARKRDYDKLGGAERSDAQGASVYWGRPNGEGGGDNSAARVLSGRGWGVADQAPQATSLIALRVPRTPPIATF